MTRAAPLRICMVATYDLAEEGGVKKHAVHLAETLRAGGDHVDLIGPYSGAEPLAPGVHGFLGVVRWQNNGSNQRLGLLVRPWEVWRFLRSGNYDVLHVHEPSIPFLAWYALWSSQTMARVATFHAYAEKEVLLSYVSRKVFCVPQFNHFHRGIAVSPVAATFARGAWERPLAIIPNGIDTKTFVPPVSARAHGPLRFLFVGHFRDSRKGLPTLIRAFERAQQGDPSFDATLDVIGAGNREILGEIPEGVRFVGPIADEKVLAEHYRSCDVFVAPSMGQESFGIVLLEAMASGRPVIASDIDGYRAVCDPAGALLFPPGDVAALSAALTTVATSAARRDAMGEANRRAAVRYDWDHVAGRVRAEYLAALAGRAEPAAASA